MTIADIRAGLDAALAATRIDRVYPEDVDHLEPPALVIGDPTVSYDDDFDENATLVFPVHLVVGRVAGADFAVRDIDPYREPIGSQSVAAAVRADSTLGDACSSARVRSAEPAVLEWNDVAFMGVRFDVEVMT